MQKYISKFHYLTQDLPETGHIEQVYKACKAGAQWIQYRCLSKSDEDLVDEINDISVICDDWGATLIITDHYHLLKDVDVQGVHIEDMSADLIKIRKQIGDEKTLGASANSFEDIQRIALTGAADYIGCGPFAHTDTKPNNHPLLGYAGYKDITTKMAENGIKIPVLAIGGVTPSDVKSLLETGVYGIAASAAVNLAEDPSQAIKDFRSFLK